MCVEQCPTCNNPLFKDDLFLKRSKHLEEVVEWHANVSLLRATIELDPEFGLVCCN